MKISSIRHLYSGGLITNYFCSSKCGHCLYGCSPEWEKSYIVPQSAERFLKKIKSLGCGSVHIGGGEPLLNLDGLLEVLKVAGKIGVGIEYVETNSSWFKNEDEAAGTLAKLKSAGLYTLLVSVSPFHNEYIPFKKVKGVISACRKNGMQVFLWMDVFLRDLEKLDENVRHSLDEYEKAFGSGYVDGLIRKYGLTMRGRTLKTYAKRLRKTSLNKILDANPGGCSELGTVSHFHVDLFGNYIPGLCTGLAISIDELGEKLDGQEYRFLNELYDSGISGLLEIAKKDFGFVPKDEYLSKCDLCLDIRTWLVKERNIRSKDLRPLEYYDRLN